MHTHMQSSWEDFDDKIRDKFQGKYGEIALREAMVAAIFFATHKVVKLRLRPRYHTASDDHWFKSLLHTHPLHPLRVAAHQKAGGMGPRCAPIFQ